MSSNAEREIAMEIDMSVNSKQSSCNKRSKPHKEPPPPNKRSGLQISLRIVSVITVAIPISVFAFAGNWYLLNQSNTSSDLSTNKASSVDYVCPTCAPSPVTQDAQGCPMPPPATTEPTVESSTIGCAKAVIGGPLNIRSGPGISYNKVGELQSGDVVEIVEIRNVLDDCGAKQPWLKIRPSSVFDSADQWIWAGAIEEVDCTAGE